MGERLEREFDSLDPPEIGAGDLRGEILAVERSLAAGIRNRRLLRYAHCRLQVVARIGRSGGNHAMLSRIPGSFSDRHGWPQSFRVAGIHPAPRPLSAARRTCQRCFVIRGREAAPSIACPVT